MDLTDKKTSIMLTERQSQWLADKAACDRRSVSFLIREMIDAEIDASIPTEDELVAMEEMNEVGRG